jgi:hypothetical protein
MDYFVIEEYSENEWEIIADFVTIFFALLR